VSRLLIVNTILLVNKGKFSKWKVVYTMTFRVAHWDTGAGSLFFFLFVEENLLLSILMASVMCLHFSMQGDDTLEHMNAKCHLCTL
jgi:hypothetical protein